VLGEWYSPPLSSILGVLGLFIFVMGSLFSYFCSKLRSRTTHCSALMLGKRPYYWPSRNLGHSMPIATRTGWISIAIMPFMMCAFSMSRFFHDSPELNSAFSTKVNYVALLTGTSHEKLQVFHRWSAAFMCACLLSSRDILWSRLKPPRRHHLACTHISVHLQVHPVGSDDRQLVHLAVVLDGGRSAGTTDVPRVWQLEHISRRAL
jgi:hypothetical protein